MKSNTSPEKPLEPASELDHISHEPGKSHAIIAKLQLLLINSSGEQVPISAAVGAPYITLDGFWRTPIRLNGFGEPAPEVYGVDSMQALYLALENIRKNIFSLAGRGNRLTDMKGNEISMEKYFESK